MNKLECYFGFHLWSYFRMALTFRKAFPEKSGWGRECVYCGKLQYLSDDLTKWNNGVRGELRAEKDGKGGRS